MLSESSILNQLETAESFNSSQQFCLFGDMGYPLRSNLMVPFKGNDISVEQHEFNSKMSKVRQCVE
jgi:hypothetical protein